MHFITVTSLMAIIASGFVFMARGDLEGPQDDWADSDDESDEDEGGRNKSNWPLCLGVALGLSVLGILLLGLLALLVVPKVVRSLDHAYHAAAMSDIDGIDAAVGLYMSKHDGTPPPELRVLLDSGTRGDRFYPEEALPLDPWGNAYLYDPNVVGESRPRIYTLGSDAQPGGEGRAADIDNYDHFNHDE